MKLLTNKTANTNLQKNITIKIFDNEDDTKIEYKEFDLKPYTNVPDKNLYKTIKYFVYFDTDNYNGTEFLDLIELDDEEYVVLLPVTEEGEEEEGEVVILKVEDTDDEDSDEESYVSIEDEDILNRVFEIFKEKFKDDFDFVD